MSSAPNPDAVITDTSCVIALDNSGALFLLRDTFRRVITTPTIAAEFGRPLPDWISIVTPVSEQHFGLDPGEESALSLALELPDCVLILDDLKARRVARKLPVSFMGTIAVILQAKQQGVIDAIAPVLEALGRAGFRASNAVIERALIAAGEKESLP
jgi:predicted nucleic acid-binding protein